MFTYVKLNNYRSLDNIYFDLKQTDKKVKKIAAVYGENGSGKSNLMRSFYFLNSLMHSFDIEKNQIEIAKIFQDKEINLSSDSIIWDFLNDNTLENLLSNSRTIGSSKNTMLEYGFCINGHQGYYLIEFNNRIIHEKMYCYTGKQSGIAFEINDGEVKNPILSEKLFKTSKFQSEIEDLILKYWGKHSLLSILYDFRKRVNSQYLNDNSSKYLYSFISMICSCCVSIQERNGCCSIDSSKKMNFISDLERGSVSKKKEWLLDNSEEIINIFLTQTYSDIKKVYFERKEEDDRIKYSLFFKKMINGEIRDIPVEQESTGTRKILNILRNLFGAFCGCTVIIDEIDNGVHDLLLKTIIESMEDYINGQLIFTTHNTSLLDCLDPKSVYIINSKFDGRKDVVCLSEFKLQDHNSARVRYMKGLFGGIPFIDSVDYFEIIQNLKEDKKPNEKA